MSLQHLTAPCLTRRGVFPLAWQGLAFLGGCANILDDTPRTAAAPASIPMDQAVQEATRQLTRKCALLWGTANVKLPARKAWVSYADDWHSRGDTDFEHGEFRAQVLVDSEAPGAKANAIDRLKQRLADAQNDTPADMADDDDTIRLARDLASRRQPSAPSGGAEAKGGPAVLAGILPQDATARLAEGALERTPVVGDDGQPRIMLTYRVAFLDGYYLKLAARYVETVRAQGDRFGVPASLILAVIETESAYNPRARSSIPAYGLMQIVPQAAGRDATAFADGQQRDLDPDYLYVAGNNIHLGAAYLKLLESRYFRGIEDPQSRLYAVIAGYNTGAGNVARAFDGTTDIARACLAINRLTPDAVYRQLRAQLPYEETRTYVAAVAARQDRYRGMDPLVHQVSAPQ